MKRIEVNHGDIHYTIGVADVEEIIEGGNKMNKVKMYRTGCGITQEQMATAIGVHTNTYRTLEDNPEKFTVEQINKYMTIINKYDDSVKATDIFLL